MKEVLISIATAKLAKEKGWENDKCSCHLDECKFDAVVTTQSLLQKWLRDEHNLHITPSYNEAGGYSLLVTKFQHNHYIEPDDYFHFYENALEVGLCIALKLIEKTD